MTIETKYNIGDEVWACLNEQCMKGNVICTDTVPYDRKGKRYELRICHDSVMITERPEEDIVRYITYLDYNGCTNNMNYQELFARA